jgi:hypothetical protein
VAANAEVVSGGAGTAARAAVASPAIAPGLHKLLGENNRIPLHLAKDLRDARTDPHSRPGAPRVVLRRVAVGVGNTRAGRQVPPSAAQAGAGAVDPGRAWAKAAASKDASNAPRPRAHNLRPASPPHLYHRFPRTP